jgi:hypothetical protein
MMRESRRELSLRIGHSSAYEDIVFPRPTSSENGHSGAYVEVIDDKS